ncbi:MAG: diaminopimelate decarboxylase [Verrucomicrobia bacterium]|nr:diaminopimelate decarboxylase [Verrucomicrobiota bacterium]
MTAFAYQNDELHAEGVSLTQLADTYGTPLYVYSKTALQTHYRALADAMAAVSPLICYSVKANSNAAVMRTLLDEGSGLDIVSGGELYRALRAGADPQKIVFAGVGKTHDEIRYALESNILFFTVESEPEAQRISQCAVEVNRPGRIAFRINPDVDPKTHQYISTGKKENKFGLDIERALRAYAMAAALPNIEISGLHMHIGSQILMPTPFGDAIAKVRDVCTELKSRYESFRYLDIGGGLGITYEPGQAPLAPTTYAAEVVPELKALGLQVVLEPGRSMVGNAGVLLARVQYVKDNPFKKFVVVDAGMNDLLRPSLYQAYHDVLPVKAGSRTIHGDLVGPICESGDFLAKDRDLPEVAEGDLLAVMSAGAYAFAMASTYNSRPLPAEVMVDGKSAWVIRERQSLDDLLKGEMPVTAPSA